MRLKCINKIKFTLSAICSRLGRYAGPSQGYVKKKKRNHPPIDGGGILNPSKTRLKNKTFAEFVSFLSSLTVMGVVLFFSNGRAPSSEHSTADCSTKSY